MNGILPLHNWTWILLSLMSVFSILSIIVFGNMLYRCESRTPLSQSNNNIASFPSPDALQHHVDKSEKSSDFSNILNQDELHQVAEDLIMTVKALHYAEIHARGEKAKNGISSAMKKMEVMLKMFALQIDDVTKRPLQKSKHFCPDKFMGGTYGNPFYDKGFEAVDCPLKSKLNDLLTVLLIHDNSSTNITDQINSILLVHPGVRIILSIRSNSYVIYGNIFITKEVKCVTHNAGDTEGKIWNSLVKKAKTEYILIGREISKVDENIHTQRLIREMETLNITVAAGSIRDQFGHWRIGCYQRALRNFTLVYHEGYDESFKECVFCDHVDGPFVIRTRDALRLKFDEHISLGVFENFFFRIGYDNTIVCPDSMFRVDSKPRSQLYKDWIPFAKKLDLYKLKFVPGFEIVFPCEEPYRCFKGKYYACHPCCLSDLASLVIQTMNICTNSHSVCELDTGTLVGAVKLGKVLPWEVDGDIMFLASNFSAMNTTGSDLAIPGLKFKVGYPAIRNKNNGFNKTGYFSLTSKYWDVEMWGMGSITSEKSLKQGRGQNRLRC